MIGAREVVLGIDPGSVDVGLALRRGRDTLLAYDVVDVSDLDTGAALENVTAAAEALLHSSAEPGALVAVEGVNDPTPHMGVVALRHVLRTAKLAAALIHRPWPHGGLPVVEVSPGGHGRAFLATYPDALVTASEKRQGLMRPASSKGKARVRHARSAWDVAGHGPAAAQVAATRRVRPSA